MFRPALALVLALAFLSAPLAAQVNPTSRPDSQPSSRPADDSQAEQESRALRLDLAIPKHDKDSYVKDEATGVAWSFLHRGKESRDTLEMGDRVRAHVTAWLAKDGTEVMSTRRREDRRANPEVFNCGAYIRGVNVVSPFLRPGDKVRIDVPAAMAFGARGMGNIGPDEDLIYAVQILKIDGHIDLPEFPAFDESKASVLKDGSSYVVLKDGDGPIPDAKSAVAFDYVLWDDKGNLIDSSLYPNKPPIGGQAGRFRFEFHNQIARIARRGGEYIVRIPFQVLFPGDPGAIVDTKSKWVFFYMATTELVLFNDAADAKMTKDPNGFEYVIVKEGDGPKTTPEDRVHFHYIYWTYPEGNIVDASYTRGMTNNFRQVGLIPGMRQALAKIGPGGIVRARVPASLAWGAAGRVGVAPNTMILLQAELFPLADPTEHPRELASRPKADKATKGEAQKKGGKKKQVDDDEDDDEEDGEDGDK